MAQQASMAAESIHAEWISPVREWIENMIRLAEDENISEDDFFEQLQNGLKSLPETRDDIFIDRLWDLQADGFKAGWEADWDEYDEIHAKGTSEGARKGWDKRGRGRRDDWKKAREGMTPKQNLANAIRAMRWVMKHKRTATRVMYRYGLGWVNFPYGRPGHKKKNAEGKTHTDGYGLSHILDKHGERALRRMPLVLTYGRLRKHQSSEKISVSYRNELVHLSRNKNRSQSWTITSYDETKNGRNDF